jgi:hypothetical protein
LSARLRIARRLRVDGLDGHGDRRRPAARRNIAVEVPSDNQPGSALILKETLSGGSYTQSTLGNPQNPVGVAVDAKGNIYFTDSDIVVKLQTAGVDFESVNVKTTSSVLSLTFTFTTAGTGITTAVSTQGAAGLDFANKTTGTCDTNGPTHPYAINDTCTIDVTSPRCLRG